METMRVRNQGLLMKLGLIGLLPIALTAVFAVYTINGSVRDRAVGDVLKDAEVVAAVGVAPRLSAKELASGLSGKDSRLDQLARKPLAGFEVSGLKVVNLDRRLVYPSSRRRLSRVEPQSAGLTSALTAPGKSGSSVKRLDSGGKRVLELYVPLRFATGEVAGAVVTAVPYGPIASTVSRDARKLALLVVSGLLLLYGVVMAGVAVALRWLNRQAATTAAEAMRDSLTGLPNRQVFSDLVERAIAGAKRDKSRVAVMLMDLDRFKEINDTLGHFNGDLLLKRIASRLNGILRQSETIARLGGDEFGILIPVASDQAAAARLASRVLKALEEHFVIGGLALEVEASIGIALYPDDGDRVTELMRAADVAMYAAKEAHSGAEFYREGQLKHSPARLALVGELRRAMDEHELVLYYQPKADLRTGEVTAVEAVVRWQHPSRGLIPPDEFIPLAEHTSLMRPVSLYLLRIALDQIRAWQAEQIRLSVAVNLSMQNLLDLQFPFDVQRLLQESGVMPTFLELEITESVIMAEPERAISVLKRLNAMGLRLAVDDFGTGYSSLAYLTQLPVSSIKIDRSFVMAMEESDNDGVIVRSTVDLGRNLGLKVVAEGVETKAVWDTLNALGCDIAQGYYLTRPLPPAEFTAWLRSYEQSRLAPAPAAAVAPVESRGLGGPRPAAVAFGGAPPRAPGSAAPGTPVPGAGAASVQPRFPVRPPIQAPVSGPAPAQPPLPARAPVQQGPPPSQPAPPQPALPARAPGQQGPPPSQPAAPAQPPLPARAPGQQGPPPSRPAAPAQPPPVRAPLPEPRPPVGAPPPPAGCSAAAGPSRTEPPAGVAARARGVIGAAIAPAIRSATLERSSGRSSVG